MNGPSRTPLAVRGVPVIIVLALAVACSSGSSNPANGIDTTVAPATTSSAATRVALSGIDRNWSGRDTFRVCVEDVTGVFGDDRARDRIAAWIESSASAANPGLPVVVEAGCPFDYPSQPLIVRTDPSVYSYQIYIRADIPEPLGEILENWLPPGTDGAIPSTLGIMIPSSMVAGDPGALRAALERFIGREPTHKPGE